MWPIPLIFDRSLIKMIDGRRSIDSMSVDIDPIHRYIILIVGIIIILIVGIIIILIVGIIIILIVNDNN